MSGHLYEQLEAGMDDYGIFENELGEWFIDTPSLIEGPFKSAKEAQDVFEEHYSTIEAYIILPYSETMEWA